MPFIGLLLILFGYGCTEKIDIKLDDTYTRLVVYGNLTTDTLAHMVELSKTSSYYYDQVPPPVTGASVEITDDQGNQVSLTEKEPGKYYTPGNFFGVAGRTYNLQIDLQEPINGNKDYTADSKLPPINPIDSIRLLSAYQGILYVQYFQEWTASHRYHYHQVDKRRRIL